MGIYTDDIKNWVVIMVMIFIDRLLRHLAKDIMLPLRCYAKQFEPKCRCDCKLFCKKPPDGGVPATLRIYIEPQRRHLNMVDN